MNILDFQWRFDKKLTLLCSLVKLITAVRNGDGKENLRTRMTEHHTVMQELTKFAPRKFGSGVNAEFLKFLSDEIQQLSEKQNLFSSLDAFEKNSLKAKLKTEKENVKLNMRSILQYLHISSILVPDRKYLGQTHKLGGLNNVTQVKMK